MQKTTKRKERRRELEENYSSGRARKSHAHGPTWNSLLQGGIDLEQSLLSATNASVPGENSSVCAKYLTILSRYSDILKVLSTSGQN